jgi:hypothetical protein
MREISCNKKKGRSRSFYTILCYTSFQIIVYTIFQKITRSRVRAVFLYTLLRYSVRRIGNYELHSGSKVRFTMNEFQSARHASL